MFSSSVINQENSFKISPLQCAASLGYEETVLQIVNSGAVLDVAKDHKTGEPIEDAHKTPLYLAIQGQHIRTAQILLCLGASKEKSFNQAKNFNDEEIFGELYALRIDPIIFRSCLYWAAQHYHDFLSTRLFLLMDQQIDKSESSPDGSPSYSLHAPLVMHDLNKIKLSEVQECLDAIAEFAIAEDFPELATFVVKMNQDHVGGREGINIVKDLKLDFSSPENIINWASEFGFKKLVKIQDPRKLSRNNINCWAKILIEPGAGEVIIELLDAVGLSHLGRLNKTFYQENYVLKFPLLHSFEQRLEEEISGKSFFSHRCDSGVRKKVSLFPYIMFVWTIWFVLSLCLTISKSISREKIKDSINGLPAGNNQTCFDFLDKNYCKDFPPDCDESCHDLKKASDLVGVSILSLVLSSILECVFPLLHYSKSLGPYKMEVNFPSQLLQGRQRFYELPLTKFSFNTQNSFLLAFSRMDEYELIRSRKVNDILIGSKRIRKSLFEKHTLFVRQEKLDKKEQLRRQRIEEDEQNKAELRSFPNEDNEERKMRALP